MSDESNLKGVHLGSQVEGTIFHGGEGVAARAWDSWSHCVCNQEADREMGGGTIREEEFSYFTSFLFLK